LRSKATERKQCAHQAEAVDLMVVTEGIELSAWRIFNNICTPLRFVIAGNHTWHEFTEWLTH